jgi:hypothetical protein
MWWHWLRMPFTQGKKFFWLMLIWDFLPGSVVVYVKAKLHSSASTSLRLSVVHLHVVVEVTLGARKNECLMNDRKIQAIHSRLWLQCTVHTHGERSDVNTALLLIWGKQHLIHIYIHYWLSLLFLQCFCFRGVVCVCVCVNFFSPLPCFGKSFFFIGGLEGPWQ